MRNRDTSAKLIQPKSKCHAKDDQTVPFLVSYLLWMRVRCALVTVTTFSYWFLLHTHTGSRRTIRIRIGMWYHFVIWYWSLCAINNPLGPFLCQSSRMDMKNSAFPAPTRVDSSATVHLSEKSCNTWITCRSAVYGVLAYRMCTRANSWVKVVTRLCESGVCTSLFAHPLPPLSPASAPRCIYASCVLYMSVKESKIWIRIFHRYYQRMLASFELHVCVLSLLCSKCALRFAYVFFILLGKYIREYYLNSF